jgi:hypothetical protein
VRSERLQTATLIGVAALATVIVTVLALYSPTLAIAGIGALFLLGLTVAKPMVGVVVWLAVLILIPDWTPLPVGLKPVSAIGVVVLIGILVSRRRERIRITWPDFALAAAVITIGILTFLDGYPIVLLSNLAAVLGVSYWLGRAAPDAARRAYLWAMVIVSIWGIFEFATRLHVFSQWALSTTHHWDLIQTRSGVDRSEAAFGHAIAYGASIAMAIPFARELPRRAGLVQLILLAGVFASVSRGPMLTAALALGLAVIFSTKGRARAISIIGLVLAMIAILAVFQLLYGSEDSDETQQSGDQRTIQLLATLPNVQWFGATGLSFEDGRVQTLGTDIIDNTFLRLAINFGWVLAALILAPLIFALFRLLRGEYTASSLALIGQIPVLLVTSLITQWQAALFFVAGMAVADLTALRYSKRTATPADTTVRARSKLPPRTK